MQNHLTTKIAILLWAMLLFCFRVSGQGNLVVNGSFETDASGWSITDVSVAMGGGYSSTFGDPPGSVVLYNALFGSSYPSPTASQEINSLTPGQFYTVSGDYTRIAGKNVSSDSFGVALDGIYLFETVAPTNSNWYSFSFNWLATSTNALLSLAAQINGTDYSYAIDNIAIYAIPEPNSLWLAGIGGIAGVLLFRNRRKSVL